MLPQTPFISLAPAVSVPSALAHTAQVCKLPPVMQRIASVSKIVPPTKTQGPTCPSYLSSSSSPSQPKSAFPKYQHSRSSGHYSFNINSSSSSKRYYTIRTVQFGNPKSGSSNGNNNNRNDRKGHFKRKWHKFKAQKRQQAQRYLVKLKNFTKPLYADAKWLPVSWRSLLGETLLLFVVVLKTLKLHERTRTLLTKSQPIKINWKSRMERFISKHCGMDVSFGSFEFVGWNKVKARNVRLTRDPSEFHENRDRNVTALHMEMDLLEIEISPWWWLQGNGFVSSVEASGVRGKIDQTHINWDGWTRPNRRESRGDFFFKNFRLSNVDLDLRLGYPKRPLNLKINYLELPQLRRQWILYDILNAKLGIGVFDGSVFSLTQSEITNDLGESSIQSKLKIDRLRHDLLTTGATGPAALITEGFVDIDVDFVLQTDSLDDHKAIHYDPIEGASYTDIINESPHLLSMDVNLKLNNLTLEVPKNDPSFNLWTKTLAMPVVAYFNTQHTCIPLSFKSDMTRPMFNGSWTPYEAELFDVLGAGFGRSANQKVEEFWESASPIKHLGTLVTSLHRGTYFLLEQAYAYSVLLSYGTQMAENGF